MTGSNLTIFRKGLLLVGLPIFFQLVFLGFLLHFQQEAADAEHWALHTKEVIVQAEEAHQLVAEAVNRMRGVIITGDSNFAPEMASASDKVIPALDNLEALVGDSAPQVERVRTFRADATQMLSWIASECQLVEEGQSAEAVIRAKGRGGERTAQKLRDQLHAILAEEQQLDRQRLDRVVHARIRGYWFIGAAAVVTVGLAAIALLVFTRGIASRLAVLADNAVRLADRQPLSHTLEGTDEIGQVDRAFRAAAGRLAEAEAAEHAHRVELEHRAEDLAIANAELARANEDLRLKTQENETFVYSVSHDLRSPLVNLQGFSKELAESCKELRLAAADPVVPPEIGRRMTTVIDGDICESVRFIQTAVSRSSGIIDALLRLSRAGKVEYKRQRVDVRAVVGRVIDAMQATLRERGAEVIVHDLPDCEADPTAVDQVFGNLLGNAVNYLDAKRPGRIEVGTLPRIDGDRSLTRYYVRDNGLGIPAAYLPKMFVAFQRLHGQIAPGEGIGLALVRRMLERLGGSINVESTEGVGSSFLVAFPAAAAISPPRMSPAPARAMAMH